jgi:hypothetical protein
MVKVIPIINFKSKTYFNAFILSAILSAFIAVVAVTLKEILKDKESDIYKFFDKLFPGKGLSFTDILIILFSVTFLSAFMAYIIMYIIFGYGSSMVENDRKISFF